jgi:hypothetical protein
MDFEVLPGPSLPEVARTALARAPAATVSDASSRGGLAAAGSRGGLAAMGMVPVRAGPHGNPLAAYVAALGGRLEVVADIGGERIMLR